MIDLDVCNICGDTPDETLDKVIPKRSLFLECHSDKMTKVIDSVAIDNKLIRTIGAGS